MDLKFDVRIVNPVVHRQAPVGSGRSTDGAEKRLTSGDAFTVADFHASRDGRWITFTGATTDRFADALDRRDSEPYLLDTSTGKLERLADNKVSESTPRTAGRSGRGPVEKYLRESGPPIP